MLVHRHYSHGFNYDYIMTPQLTLSSIQVKAFGWPSFIRSRPQATPLRHVKGSRNRHRHPNDFALLCLCFADAGNMSLRI